MPLGIVPSGKGWKIKSFGIGSTFTKGDALGLNPARTVRPYLSTDSQFLGVAMHDSISSLPAGQVLVAIPEAGAEATIDVPAGIGSSSLSFGQVYSISSTAVVGAQTSYLSLLIGSHFSRLVTIEGPIQISQASRILVSFRQATVVGSSSTLTFAT